MADTWVYQPTATVAPFKGDSQSKTLDLTQLSWRQPPAQATEPAFQGPFTCPFCAAESPAATVPPEPTVDVTLMGEGKLTLTFVDAAAEGDRPAVVRTTDRATLVPFKGGLNREVPASYHLSAASLDQPLAVVVEGMPTTARPQPATLQITGPGYTANFEGLSLPRGETLTMYVVPNTTGPELTFVAQRAMEIPKLSINLTDDTRNYQFDSSTPGAFSLTQRQVAKSSGFDISGLKLPAGKRVGLSTKGDLKRLYFADDDTTTSQYALTVKNRMVIKDRIQLGERQPDFINYTLTYEEEMRARNVQVEAQTQAFFDYDPAFIDPAQRPREELLAAFEQRDFPITIAYEPLAASPGQGGPLRMTPSASGPTGKRVFQGSLQKGVEK
ncbi:MAG: hypothetical protein HC922_11510 [Leptolyngbyaceae cyanobacterium SM2_3_12]|nr:hypothetical protein [Leptolyngbyaceae cyanobacterium SM2_3_12]